MRRHFIRVSFLLAGVYALAWTGYVVKSAAGIDLMRDGIHHGPIFPGSDAVVAWLHHA